MIALYLNREPHNAVALIDTPSSHLITTPHTGVTLSFHLCRGEFVEKGLVRLDILAIYHPECAYESRPPAR